ncbi:MAG: EF-P lysine aminoacylase GenX [Proteobacteria bacterium]|nr:EF-P lysine aminoacylase GenX [Pseudomonadota bacterium]
MTAPADWRPGASVERLRRRAGLLRRTRQFFEGRGLLEVDTPFVVNAPVSDVHIHSAEVRLEATGSAVHFLHTSPEYAMKRLLAAGSGDIYQICHVARGHEQGRFHNSEFTLVEWYRIGFGLGALMEEVAALVCELLAEERPTEFLTYREALLRETGLDAFATSTGELAACAAAGGLAATDPGRDECLDFIMGTLVGPKLGHGRLTFVHGYPASQAALARLDPADPRAAQRFELYAQGLELANGFHELGEAHEQRARFEADQAERRRRALPVHPLDERLLAALGHGLPDCSGVALGFDRVAMLALGARHIEEVLPFATPRA